MSTDVTLLPETVYSTSPQHSLELREAPVSPARPYATATTATLAAHAVDRSEARLARLEDELDQLRSHTGADVDLDVGESRLLAEITVAERALKACTSMAAAVSGRDVEGEK